MPGRTDPLAEYRRRRDFKATAEPAGKVGKPGGNRFIVQKHDATRLHWDLRLEKDGVLKSWAVTAGPSLDPADKRLAVRTEDHPLSYAEFEGVIPKREYGGGTVMLWDRGSWAPVEGKTADDLDKGHLHFRLDGERMKGEWLLVRMRGKPGEKRENWLLRKIGDDHTGARGDLIDRCLTSVLTGRSMAEIAADTGGERALAGKSGDAFAAEMTKAARHNARAAKASPRARRPARPPAFRKPQLATLVDAVPTGNDWLHEIKFDGYRALVAAAGSAVRIYTRNGLDWTDKFAPLVAVIAALDLPPCLIDGEITAPGPDGNPSFSALQAMLKRGHGEQGARHRLDLHAFDLLALDGADLTALPTIARKERLAALLGDAAPLVHVADHVIGAGERLFDAMCAAGQEGIIAKRIDAPYRSARTMNWVKIKCTRRQEFVIVGWSPSRAKGRPFASLLLAQREDDALVYKGKVGTGFDADAQADLARRLKRLARKTAPLDVAAAEQRGAQWVTPELVAEVAFAEFTGEGRVRHASFVGLRGDRPATEVGPERARGAPAPAAGVRISSRDRVIFPESGQTKGDLANYYAAVSPLMLAHLAHRPVSLVRCPQGRAKQCFFQKHDGGGMGDAVHHVAIREKDGGNEDYLYVEDAAGILQCVQMGTIEFHGWGSRVDDVEAPDRLVLDLDPDEELDFADVKRAAADLRHRLDDLGLQSFAMLSGGKGVHVVVPLTPGHDWVAHKDFARRFAEAMALAEPDRFVATMRKAKRRGRIFIDWLRNQRGATAVLPYSARARPGAPVAVPVDWGELDAIASSARWSIADAAQLVERAAAPSLRGWGHAAQQLPDL
ncbi:DNA ligase D [Sphingomonas sp. SFZ2018-12]|uniref:DNA ligase D n=1 Tax=Sphingomonas sp. SFZ2018-12 TaxID=2683197 RepID=UPI001F0EB228|nr:DNA ligase D [Sphingomonas sp. SFZ2018-12]MCH4894511.1 DNA ligase D [Sphingomonas sp. SFZ2018-12]